MLLQKKAPTKSTDIWEETKNKNKKNYKKNSHQPSRLKSKADSSRKKKTDKKWKTSASSLLHVIHSSWTWIWILSLMVNPLWLLLCSLLLLVSVQATICEHLSLLLLLLLFSVLFCVWVALCCCCCIFCWLFCFWAVVSFVVVVTVAFVVTCTCCCNNHYHSRLGRGLLLYNRTRCPVALKGQANPSWAGPRLLRHARNTPF